jgi:hypothetical protein
MARVTTIDLDMPPDFPAAEYNGVHARVNLTPQPQPPRENWRRFARSWNAVAHRFRACADYDDRFRESLRMHGDGPGPEVRHGQERDLYGFFTNGMSVVDSFCCALHALGEMPRSQPRRDAPSGEALWPRDVRRAFERLFARDQVTVILATVLESAEYGDCLRMRNTLAHREVTSRQFFLKAGNPGPGEPAMWGDSRLDESLTRVHREWLAQVLSELLASARVFAEQRLPEP